MTCQLMKELSELIVSGQRNVEVLEALQNVDPRNLVNDSGASLLHIAAEKGNVSIAQHLLDIGVDVDLQDKNGTTALMLAIEQYNSDTIHAILEFNPNLDIHDNLKKVSTLKLLLDRIYGLFYLHTVEKIYQALERESQGDIEKIAMRLVNAECTLHAALRFRNAELLRLMLRSGRYNDQILISNGATALHVAFDNHDLPCVKVLLDHGFNVDAISRHGSRTTFSYYERFDDSDLELEVWQIVFQRSRHFTKTALFDIRLTADLLARGKKKVLRILLQSEFDLTATDDLGLSPLYYLARNPTLAIDEDLNELLRKKQWDFRKLGTTVHGEAAEHGQIRLLELLLEHNDDLRLRWTEHRRFGWSNEGYPILFLAYQGSYDAESRAERTNYYKCVKLLLQHRCDPQELKDGKTIFDCRMNESKLSDITNLILMHLAILEMRHVPIIDPIRAKIDSHQWLSNQFNLCKLHLARLKNIRNTNFISLYEFMCKNDEQMAFCLLNDEFLAALLDIGDKYKNDSDYFNIIWGYFEKPIEKARLMRIAVGLVYKITGFSYNQYRMIVNEILRYFTNKDLKQLLLIFEKTL